MEAVNAAVENVPGSLSKYSPAESRPAPILEMERRQRDVFKNSTGTDGSAHAAEAPKYARDLALRDDAQVVVVHAFEPVSTYLGEPWLHRVMACHYAAGREVADQAVRELQDAGIDVGVEVLEGPPADATLRVAEVCSVT